MITASAILARATAQLAASPDLRETTSRDALTLLLHTLGMTRAQLYANPDREITAERLAVYEAAIARRLKNEPIQYITGEQEFYGLTLRVTPAVLIPRPETEHLVESVLAELAPDSRVAHPFAASPRKGGLPFDSAVRILDIGTGSGAIAIALAHHLPHTQITATDISPAALDIARENAARHNLADRIDFIQSDLLDSVRHKGHTREATATREARRERYEVLVSNPPYIPESDRETLHPQVRDYEPATALFAPVVSGKDHGLAIYRRLIPQARAALVPNGLLALEMGHGQRDALAGLLSGWNSVRFVDDLQGVPRVALARNSEPPAPKL
ncbi:MAG TPA: peptide chain release factor N(5)-glutamine methyltransferase [Acidobacteriaceae bacterium]|nr:peptide chain release factor N(5)-glutamine methyltransferase [Acidobacteriaceae bacterium]